jgi:hypothetical protein
MCSAEANLGEGVYAAGPASLHWLPVAGVRCRLVGQQTQNKSCCMVAPQAGALTKSGRNKIRTGGRERPCSGAVAADRRSRKHQERRDGQLCVLPS